MRVYLQNCSGGAGESVAGAILSYRLRSSAGAGDLLMEVGDTDMAGETPYSVICNIMYTSPLGDLSMWGLYRLL